MKTLQLHVAMLYLTLAIAGKKMALHEIDDSKWRPYCSNGKSQAVARVNSQCLLIVPRGGALVPGYARTDDEQVAYFVEHYMAPRNAILMLRVGRGTKRHKLLETLAEDEKLAPLAVFAVQHVKGGSNLTLHLHRYSSKAYQGKWTQAALGEWIQDMSYPLVNRIGYELAAAKYFNVNPYGVVLIVKRLDDQSNELVELFERYATKFRHRLRFTFFSKTSESDELCRLHGILTNDEVLILETPNVWSLKTDSYVPPPPRYRLERVYQDRVVHFFNEYEAGKWPRYYRSSPAATTPKSDVRELSGRDFNDVVSNPLKSVMVLFVNSACQEHPGCKHASTVFATVAREVVKRQQQDPRGYAHIILASIDQTANEHPEYISGTPWVRFWPRGKRKKPVNIIQRKLLNVDVAYILDFIEERIAEDSHGSPDATDTRDEL